MLKMPQIPLFFLYLLMLPLYASEWIADPDESGRVKIVAEFVRQKIYKISLLDAFEGNSNWSSYRNISHLNRIDIVPVLPNKQPFLEETAIFKKLYPEDTSLRSLVIQSYFENPGRQHLEIRPAKPIQLLPGRPVKLVIWVYSNNYDMKLKTVFSQKKSKDFTIEAAALDFDGWKRIEADFILPDKNLKLLESHQYPVYLKSLILQSGPRLKKGEFFLYLDRMYLIMDEQNKQYPGSEIRDHWEKND